MARPSASRLRAVAAGELAAFRAARRKADWEGAWRSLERAHIAAQPILLLHGRVHFEMLRFAIARRHGGEAIGQLLRLLLVPLGNGTGRLPVGNTGRANVSAFAPMPVPPDLAAEIDREE
jgi:hypothetical protein